MLDYESCCRLLETLILVSGQGKMPKVYSKIAEKVFKAKLLAFAVHPQFVFPTHYVGDEGYFSDTEDTESAQTPADTNFENIKDEL